jgi:NitT/TauT family transport system substrate-binding protein
MRGISRTLCRNSKTTLYAFLLLLIIPDLGLSQATKPLKVNWSSNSAAYLALWMTREQGYFDREGLSVEFTHILSTSRAMQAVVAGDIDVTTVDPVTVVQSSLAGADVKMFLAITNRFGFSVMVQPEIQSPEQLKGKVLGVTRYGSSTDTALRFILNQWKVLPMKDVALLQVGGVPEILSAMAAKQLAGGALSPPTNTRARGMGFRELINLGTDGPEFPSVALGTNSRMLAQADVMRKFVRAYIQGLYHFRRDKASSIKTVEKYLRVTDRDVLEDTYRQFRDYIAEPPYISKPGFEHVIRLVAETNSKARGKASSDFVDERALEEQAKNGFLDSVRNQK